MKHTLLILFLCGALLTAAGCRRPAGETPAPAAPAAPTSGTAASLPTAAPTETFPSTGTTVTGTAPTAPVPPPVPVRGELGGPAFTLGGQTFTMGESPDRLLTFLGEPEESYEYGDSLYDGTDHFYHYEDVWVTAFQPTGSDGAFLTDVYFRTDRYSFNGLSVGSSAADLRRAAALPENDPETAAYPLFRYEEFQMHTEIGGWGYLLDNVQETPGNTYWVFLFTYEEDPQKPADDAPILCIHLCYVYPFATLY